jgi:hypothetical protein
VIAGQRDRVVARIALTFEQLTDESGRALDAVNYLGLEFEGPPELADRFAAGDRVQIATTTPSGVHIATISPVAAH